MSQTILRFLFNTTAETSILTPIKTSIQDMGLPLSRFQMMSGLFSGDEFCVRKLSQFKMVCIVLPDPYDELFYRRMRDNFLSLHEQTGQDMLFISFVKPPNRWYDTQHSMDFSSLEKRNLYAEEGSNDKQLISSFIRSVAPNVQLPAIIVTDDLMSSEYAILESSISQFEKQLKEIGLFCTNSEGRTRVNDGHFLEVLNRLGNYHLTLDESRPLAARLADVFAVQNRNYKLFSKSWADARLKVLKEEMKNGGQDATVAFYEYEASIMKAQRSSLELYSIGSLNHLYKRNKRIIEFNSDELLSGLDQTRTFHEKYSIDPHQINGFCSCDPLSKSCIHQFNLQLQFIELTINNPHPTEDELMYLDTERTSVRSFSPLSCFIDDFMDREINLSLVQQMRQLYGIEMPQYYARFKPNCWAIVRTPREDIKLNAVKHPDLLKPTMFGQALYAYEEMCRNGMIQASFGDAFLALWRILHQCRNTNDHAQYDPDRIMNYPRFVQQYDAFSQVLKNYLGRMMAIKDELRGHR